MLDLSKVWPEWTAEEKLGEGAYGSVYKCIRRERGITSYCAIKVISVPHDSSEIDSLKLEGYTDETSKEYFNDIVDSFSNEIGVMENLKGFPNIVSVEDFKIVEHVDGIGWDIYIRMELLTSFKQYLETHSMTNEDVLKLGRDICTALEICEKNGIIHRDIKADNIFVDKSGNFKLGDFGVARQLERTRSTMSRKGTYSYMAPEVVMSGKYDKRADIYSLGMVMYKLLNKNRDPFLDTEKQMIRYQERADAVNRRLDGEALPKPVDADENVAEIILKACMFNKEERFSCSKEMKSEIINIIRTTEKEAEKKPEPKNVPDISETKEPEAEKAPALSKPSKSRKKTAGIIAAVLALIVVAVGLVFGANAIKKQRESDTVVEQTVAQSPNKEEEMYAAYLNSEEGQELCYGSYLFPEEEEGASEWTGGKDINYIDIDNDGIKECFYCLEFTDGYRVYCDVYLFDIQKDKVINIHTFEGIASAKWGDMFLLTKKDGQYLLSLKKIGGSGYATSVSYSYDGNELAMINSTYKEHDYNAEKATCYMSTTVNLHGNAEGMEDSMKIEESVFYENWDSLAENIELAYAVDEFDNGKLSNNAAEGKLFEIFEKSEYYDENSMRTMNCRDYDNDGNFEMMLYQFTYDEITDVATDGKIYYITENGVQDIKDVSGIQYPADSGYMGNNKTVCINDRWFFSIEEVFTTMAVTHLYTVIDGKIEDVSISDGYMTGCLEIVRPYGAGVSFSAYDNFIDGAGHTYKQYYFRWDEKSKSFMEYGAIEISQEEFLKCDGAKELLNEIKNKGYEISNILYRSNGIININYVINETECDNINLKLAEDGSLVVLHDGYTGLDGNNGFGGVYMRAVSPDTAVYPEKFPLQ